MTDQELYQKAAEARARAYVPYSRYPVGACLLATDGRVFTGCNIENASFGATMCAERVAVGKAVSEGATSFEAIAVSAEGAIPWPCGICRQVLSEFSPNMRVIVAPVGGELRVHRLRELLAEAFVLLDTKEC